MDWTTLAATGLGAFIGVVSTVVADRSRYRRETANRDREDQKVMFARCLVSFRQAHEAMRVASMSHATPAGAHLAALILDAYRSAGADEAREAMMLVAPDEVLSAVDVAYHKLREIRKALV